MSEKSLQSTRDAVIRIGALLILKVDWAIAVHQLTAEQQFLLDHQRKVVLAPKDVMDVLGIEQPVTADEIAG